LRASATGWLGRWPRVVVTGGTQPPAHHGEERGWPAHRDKCPVAGSACPRALDPWAGHDGVGVASVCISRPRPAKCTSRRFTQRGRRPQPDKGDEPRPAATGGRCSRRWPCGVSAHPQSSKQVFQHGETGRAVESRRGAVSLARPVSPPRSSNRTCGFPASGFPTGFTAGIRRVVT